MTTADPLGARVRGAAGSDGKSGEPRQMRTEVLEGLSRDPKSLSPKFFYDERGSRLFEAITRLPEYYLTRTERGLLEGWVPEWVSQHRPGTLVELGAGSARKTEIILDAMTAEGCGRLYVPVDVSADFLAETGERIRDEYPSLEVAPLVADMSEELHLEAELPHPILFALLGSTIGNFPGDTARDLLARIAGEMAGSDVFMMGADLRAGDHKPVEVLEAAYNDARGVTADFNLNVLRVLNRELGTNFDLDAFEHRAFYDADRGQIEMHLVSRADQEVRMPGAEPIRLRPGETIRTEISAKYSREGVVELLEAAGMELLDWRQDGKDRYALCLAGKVS